MEMKTASRALMLIFLAAVLVTASGCAAIAGIFKAGMWVGIVVAVLVIGGIMFLASRFTGQ